VESLPPGLLHAGASGAIEATFEPAVDLQGERGVASFVACDPHHGGADLGIGSRAGLPGGDERAKRLADASLDRILGRHGLEIAQGVRRDAWPCGPATVPICKSTRGVPTPNLVTRGALGCANESSRRPMSHELALQMPESVDRRLLETRHFGELTV
jgi:hypothetical protein